MSVSARSRKRQVQRLQAARKPSPFVSLDYLKGYAKRIIYNVRTNAEIGRVENMRLHFAVGFTKKTPVDLESDVFRWYDDVAVFK